MEQFLPTLIKGYYDPAEVIDLDEEIWECVILHVKEKKKLDFFIWFFLPDCSSLLGPYCSLL